MIRPSKFGFRFTLLILRYKFALIRIATPFLLSFGKLVLPILNYGCKVWGFHTANNIERVHTQYCKKTVLKDPHKTILCMEDFHCL